MEIPKDSTRDDRIAALLPMVRRIAARIARRLPDHVQIEDLVGAGLVGLTEAASRFDPDREERFVGYATMRIRGAILDELRRSDFLPRGRRERVRELDAAVERLEQQHGAPPTPEQLAARRIRIDASC